MISPIALGAIRDEYACLCALLGITPVTLDLYEFEPDSEALTAAGTPVAEGAPGFSPSLTRIWLPIAAGDPLPSSQPSAPTRWTKAAPEWHPWRIEVWHETIHQLSENLGVYDSKEPGRLRSNGTKSTTGHGAGWWTAINDAATKLSKAVGVNVSPDELDALLDGGCTPSRSRLPLASATEPTVHPRRECPLPSPVEVIDMGRVSERTHFPDDDHVGPTIVFLEYQGCTRTRPRCAQHEKERELILVWLRGIEERSQLRVIESIVTLGDLLRFDDENVAVVGTASMDQNVRVCRPPLVVVEWNAFVQVNPDVGEVVLRCRPVPVVLAIDVQARLREAPLEVQRQPKRDGALVQASFQ